MTTAPDAGRDGKPQGHSFWFVLVATLFTTCLIASNIVSVKLFAAWGLILPAGMVIFPFSYIFGDVLTEVYGYGQTKRVIWLGFFCNLLVVLTVLVGQALPPAPFWKDQEAYATILGFTPRLLVASFTAYLVGEFANSFVLARMKVLTEGRWLWARTIGSTVVGQGLDSLIFIILAFAFTIPTQALLSAIASQWVVKVAYEAAITPVTYIVVRFLKRRDRSDVYDRTTRFNPLLILD